MKNEITSFESGIKAFEALGADKSPLKCAADVSARVDALKIHVGDIAKAFTVRSNFWPGSESICARRPLKLFLSCLQLIFPTSHQIHRSSYRIALRSLQQAKKKRISVQHLRAKKKSGHTQHLGATKKRGNDQRLRAETKGSNLHRLHPIQLPQRLYFSNLNPPSRSPCPPNSPTVGDWNSYRNSWSSL